MTWKPSQETEASKSEFVRAWLKTLEKAAAKEATAPSLRRVSFCSKTNFSTNGEIAETRTVWIDPPADIETVSSVVPSSLIDAESLSRRARGREAKPSELSPADEKQTDRQRSFTPPPAPPSSASNTNKTSFTTKIRNLRQVTEDVACNADDTSAVPHAVVSATPSQTARCTSSSAYSRRGVFATTSARGVFGNGSLPGIFGTESPFNSTTRARQKA